MDPATKTRATFARFVLSAATHDGPGSPLKPSSTVRCGARLMSVAVVLRALWARVTAGLGTHLSRRELNDHFGLDRMDASTLFGVLNRSGKNVSYTEFEAFVLRQCTVEQVHGLARELWPADADDDDDDDGPQSPAADAPLSVVIPRREPSVVTDAVCGADDDASSQGAESPRDSWCKRMMARMFRR